MDDNRPRWIDMQFHLLGEFEENNEENEDVDNDGDVDMVSDDDSGYGSNSGEEDNDMEMTDDSESEDELMIELHDLNENSESAYMVLGEVQGLPEALLLQKTTWREFERRIIDEIRTRHYAWELDIIFEHQLLLYTGVYEYWCQQIFRLQTRVQNLIPNFRIFNTAGVPLCECRMRGRINMHVSEIGSFYKIILKVEHRGHISHIV